MDRGFEVVSAKSEQQINLPMRQTKSAAGYDFECSEDFVLPSIWKYKFVKIFKLLHKKNEVSDMEFQEANAVLKPFLVPTGIKAYMQPNEFLLLANRSSNPLKRRLVLPNGVGIVDADYYNNSGNEGEIFFQLLNFGVTDVKIKKGERIGQGIFVPYLTTDTETVPSKKRSGGFGSTKK
ncbi:dUTP diphosphatase [Paucilactobacillus hokkaidonensis JCM 18461]|uniref:dUTP diphosphatase n=2 Tax=Paucilactobacillus hokkaidonensis TaxID=1193095 RepID=A0A0A1GVG3_9LACO|nr:dUTP diphosphatase [Paucilactobacillus hokkaidonensis]BAP85014.1 dUTP diphosphatase [Paucilactobacillus hokkaidonensis JCM 18461]